MKYKPKKMWKPLILFIFIAIMFVSIPTGYKYLNSKKKNIKTDEIKLRNIGYSLNDISLITKNKKLIKYALKNNYDNLLIDYLKIPEFKIEKIKYYKKYQKNNKNAKIDDIVKIVNLGIDIQYSDKLVNIINSKYYIKNKTNQYLEYNSKDNVNDIIKYVNCGVNKEFYTETKQTDISKGILMLVNKYHYLTADFEGLDLVSIDYQYGSGNMNKEAYENFIKMSDDARNQGLYILAQSTYRNYQTQESIYNNYVLKNGKEWTDLVSARPGYSEHQTGLAIDVKTYSTKDLGDFLYTNEYKWMIDNSYKYGFVLRYPENAKELTGYDFESWHYRYVGLNAARIIHDDNLLFDEYYAYYIEKRR